MLLPRPAVRGALAQARRWAEVNPGVLAVGEGYKHRGGRYARGGGLCVKVFVRRKRHGVAGKVPSSFAVSYRGVEHRVATDVEALRDVKQQSLACGASGAPSRRGTVGAFATGGGGRFALTAGHVFEGTFGSSADVGGIAAGEIRRSATSIIDDFGQLLDVGTIELTAAEPDWSQLQPWKGVSSVLPTSQLWRLFAADGSGPTRAVVFGAAGRVLVDLDTLVRTPLQVPGIGRAYAPPLLFYRVVSGKLAGGYSGSAVTSSDGARLLGVHVLGKSKVGYAQPAERLRFVAGEALGVDLTT